MADINLALEVPQDAVLMEVTAKASQNADNEKNQFKWYVRQTLTSIGPTMGTIAAGITSGYSAVLIPQLQPTIDYNFNSTVNDNLSILNNIFEGTRDIVVETTEQKSWVAASSTLLMAPGCWISGLLMEKMGRKASHLIVSPIFMIGWIMVGLAPSMSWLIVGRLLCGLCVGLHGPLGVVYVAETSHPRLRGILIASMCLAFAVGVLFVHALGTWLDWRFTAYLCAIFPVLCFLFCVFTSESPQWLLGKMKMRKAQEAWIYLRGEHCMSEFATLKTKGTEYLENGNQRSAWRTAIGSRAFLMPLLILNVYFLTTQFSGSNAVAFYSVEMLKDVSGPEYMYSATLILDVIRLIVSVVACWLTRNFGRRLLTFVSGVGSTVSLIGLSTCIFFDIGKSWLPILFLFSFICMSTVGLVPLPWLLCGELFSASVRGFGSGLTSGFGFICFFVVIKTEPIMFENLQTYGTFFVYGIIAMFGTIFLYFFLPETKDKTLQEIEEAFTKKKKKKTSRNVSEKRSGSV